MPRNLPWREFLMEFRLRDSSARSSLRHREDWDQILYSLVSGVGSGRQAPTPRASWKRPPHKVGLDSFTEDEMWGRESVETATCFG